MIIFMAVGIGSIKMARYYMFSFLLSLMISACSSGASQPVSTSTKNEYIAPSEILSTTIKAPSSANIVLTINITPTSEYAPLPSGISMTNIVGKILKNPAQYMGKQVEVIGYYRGWDLLGEAQTGPPITRSDWVIKDNSGAIYIVGISPKGVSAGSTKYINIVIRLNAVVRQNKEGQVYLEGYKIETLLR
jgi:hypothetical protein